MLRTRGIYFQLLAKMSHINAQIVTMLYGIGPPYLTEELALGEHFTGVIQQYSQQAEFNRGEMNFFAATGNSP